YWLVGATNCTSKVRTAAIVPSPVGEKQVNAAPPTQSDGGAKGSSYRLGVSEVPPVAATSVPISSTVPGTAAVEPSNEMPHSTNVIGVVTGVAICRRVLMAAPVAAASSLAVVGSATLPAI